MIRKAFRMSINPGQEEEYEKRHDALPEEMRRMFERHGVRRYYIFIDEADRSLFSFVEMEDEEKWNAIAATPECQRWWRHMSEIMPSHPDNSPVENELRPVFEL